MLFPWRFLGKWRDSFPFLLTPLQEAAATGTMIKVEIDFDFSSFPSFGGILYAVPKSKVSAFPASNLSKYYFFTLYLEVVNRFLNHAHVYII